jgi:hypothetical protein
LTVVYQAPRLRELARTREALVDYLYDIGDEALVREGLSALRFLGCSHRK